MKTINRRSFFGQLAGLFGLFFALPSEAITQETPVFDNWALSNATPLEDIKAGKLYMIGGGDLEQQMEEFMLLRLKEIQIRASEEGAEFLLDR